MRQNRLLLLLCSLFSVILIPSNVFAKQEVTNLKQTIDDEINVFSSADGYEEYVNQLKSIDLGDYSDSKDKVNVYLFRGSSCSHCFDAVVCQQLCCLLSGFGRNCDDTDFDFVLLAIPWKLTDRKY